MVYLCSVIYVGLLIPIGKVLGMNLISNKNTTAEWDGGLTNVGPDGVSFLYHTKLGGFVWYMNPEHPFDSHFESIKIQYGNLVTYHR